MSRWKVIATTFVELADTIGDDFNSFDFLQNLVERAAQITDCDVASLLLSDQRGLLRLTASTDHQTPTHELFAIANEDGPCLASFHEASPVVNIDPAEAVRRWPVFAPAALRAGYSSTHVVPMLIRAEVLGTLTILYRDVRTVGEDDLAILQALASVATIGMLHERTPRQRELLAERMQSSLNLQVTVEQAKGIVAQTLGVDVDRAFQLLRDHGVRSGLPLGAVSTAVVQHEIHCEQLLPDHG